MDKWKDDITKQPYASGSQGQLDESGSIHPLDAEVGVKAQNISGDFFYEILKF